NQLVPDSPFYNTPTAAWLLGTLDIEALARSLNEVVRRHENLRTTFRAIDDQPVQIIAPELTLPLPLIDLSSVPEDERQAAALRMVQEETAQPFDLSRGPLIRAKLLRLNTDQHLILLTLHHIVSDGWSRQVLTRELAALYAAFSTGQPSPLPELPFQYADYAVWQQQWLQGAVMDHLLGYWKPQLADAPTVLALPIDRPRPPVQSFRGADYLLNISQELLERLTTLSRQAGVTLFMTLLAAYNVLLAYHSNQDDILVGSPIANRNRSQIEGLIGMLANMLVLRTRLSNDLPFQKLLAQVRDTALDAYAHQDLPFEKLVEEIQPERSLSYSPLFQVAFALQNVSAAEIAIDDLRLSVLDAERNTATFDINLRMWESAEGLHGAWGYSTDLFDETTIARLARDFHLLLQTVAEQPHLTVDELTTLLAEHERQQQRSKAEELQASNSQKLRRLRKTERSPHGKGATEL
ncbi:MAG TPA: condensation domain-containing protein, partial [Herpetosiphonaceae bacterium]